MFFRIVVLKNFAMFTGKHLCWRFFLIKLQAFRPPSGLQHRCFPVKFAAFLRTPFFTEQVRWLLLEISQELSLYWLHMRMMNIVISWYLLTLQRFFHFFLFYCVCFVSFYFFLLSFFVWILLLADVQYFK